MRLRMLTPETCNPAGRDYDRRREIALAAAFGRQGASSDLALVCPAWGGAGECGEWEVVRMGT